MGYNMKYLAITPLETKEFPTLEEAQEFTLTWGFPDAKIIER
jgi:hypothetical protein